MSVCDAAHSAVLAYDLHELDGFCTGMNTNHSSLAQVQLADVVNVLWRPQACLEVQQPRPSQCCRLCRKYESCGDSVTAAIVHCCSNRYFKHVPADQNTRSVAALPEHPITQCARKLTVDPRGGTCPCSAL